MDRLYARTEFDTSHMIIHNYSTSFFSETNLLDKELREPIFGIYGFVRLADERGETDKTEEVEEVEGAVGSFNLHPSLLFLKFKPNNFMQEGTIKYALLYRLFQLK